MPQQDSAPPAPSGDADPARPARRSPLRVVGIVVLALASLMIVGFLLSVLYVGA